MVMYQSFNHCYQHCKSNPPCIDTIHYSDVKRKQWHLKPLATQLFVQHHIQVMLNENNGISNHWQLNCLFNITFRLTTKENQIKALVGLCKGNPLVTSGFHWQTWQRCSNAESVSLWRCFQADTSYKVLSWCFKVDIIMVRYWAESQPTGGRSHEQCHV